jgi:hypothetical protein
MSAFEVIERYGTWALVRFVLGMLAFLTLHLIRLPLLMLARMVEALMRRLDAFVAAGVPTQAASAMRTAEGST